ncbi:hypothetical protein GGS23DRAFT_616368 [Durotheca rogersii]|uniref:uncharacterized protein n=1 Tax=Durotheca rogersii TaxID=419775 RepID=UPI00221E4144|nr:uncharacterized protein GGS23DRAFT_616368 [Durotheca rogersii]KAI5859262.1 hypothetical protein GGS23DRAFT_616368 [Durotheca rogersii]
MQRFDDRQPRVCRFSKPRIRGCLLKAALAMGTLELALERMRFRPSIPNCKGTNGARGTAGIKWYATKFKEIDGSREYELKAKFNDWPGFVREAKVRTSIPPCPQQARVPTYGRKWVVPRDGPNGMIFCTACYCDHVVHTGEGQRWKAAENYTQSRETKARCGMSVLGIGTAMTSAQEGGVWYTLPSNPVNFGVCASCYVAALEPLGVPQFFVRQPAAPFLPRLLETCFTRGPTSFDQAASAYASIPLCRRDEDVGNRRWYGRSDCAICPEGYLDFARHSPLAGMMELENTSREAGMMCELYSPRMRTLHKQCGEAPRPDPAPLLASSVRWRLIWAGTVPRIRMMLFQGQMMQMEQQMLNGMSLVSTTAGGIDQINYGSLRTYSSPAVRHGFQFDNMNLLRAAVYTVGVWPRCK